MILLEYGSKVLEEAIAQLLERYVMISGRLIRRAGEVLFFSCCAPSACRASVLLLAFSFCCAVHPNLQWRRLSKWTPLIAE